MKGDEKRRKEKICLGCRKREGLVACLRGDKSAPLDHHIMPVASDFSLPVKIGPVKIGPVFLADISQAMAG